ncbi:MAG: hypothetical protein IPG45_08675 [Deltaproteobacteria bacterium]|nr:hypothetical protein [Deltaproteobacteria bacterium]
MCSSTLVLLAILLGGCAASLRKDRVADLRQRAAFDLSCPFDQLVVIPLDEAAKEHGGGTTGVSGCGRQATYLWDGYTGNWVMNSAAPPRE